MVWIGDNVEQLEVDERLETCMKYFMLSVSGSLIALLALLSTNMLRNQIDYAAVMPVVEAIFIVQIVIMSICGIMVYIATLLKINFYEKRKKQSENNINRNDSK